MPANEQENAIKIAVLGEQMTGLREQQKSHADEMREAISRVQVDIVALTAVMNRGKGAFTASMMFAGAIGAAILAIIAAIGGWLHR